MSIIRFAFSVLMNLIFLVASGNALALVNIEDVPIYEIELATKTGSRKDANTDDTVYVRFNDEVGDIFSLNYSHDDRERGKTDRYHVFLRGVSKISDIKKIDLTKLGIDGWCLEKVELFINGDSRPLFSHDFGSNCHWIDGDDGDLPTFVFNSTDLRSDRNWTINGRDGIQNPPNQIDDKKVKSMVESIIGHFVSFHNRLKYGKKYGSDYVELQKVSDNKLHVDLDLAAEVPGPNAEVDVDFDININCSNNLIKVSTSDLDVELNSWIEDWPVIGDMASWVIDSDILKKYHLFKELEKAMEQINRGSQWGYACSDAKFNRKGGIVYRWKKVPASEAGTFTP